MLNRFTLAGLVCAFLLTRSDASAGFFRRKVSPPVQSYTTPSYATPYYPECPAGLPGGDATSSNAAPSEELLKALAAKLTKEELEQFQEIAAWNEGAWFGQIAHDAGKITENTKEEDAPAIVGSEMAKYLSGSSDDRKKAYDYFKKETAPLTADESTQFLDMVKANKFKTSDFLSYASVRASQRAKIYKEFKETGGAAPEVTPEELTQFMEIVKANKEAKKGAFNDVQTFYPLWQAMTPAQRKAIYEARGK